MKRQKNLYLNLNSIVNFLSTLYISLLIYGVFFGEFLFKEEYHQYNMQFKVIISRIRFLVLLLLFICCIYIFFRNKKQNIINKLSLENSFLILLFFFVIIEIFFIKNKGHLNICIGAILSINLGFEKTLKVILYSLAIFMLSWIALALCDILIISVTRGNCLGLHHYNAVGWIVLIFNLLMYYLLHDKYYFRLAISLISLVFVAVVVTSRTTLICLVLLMMISYFERNRIICIKNSIIYYLIINTPIILLIFSILLGVLINGFGNVEFMDGNFLYRFKIFDTCVKDMGISLFPNVVPNHIILDNMYLDVLFEYGLIYTVFYVYFLEKCNKNMINDGNYVCIDIMMIIYIYGLMEHKFVNMLLFISLMYMLNSDSIKN